MVHTHGHPRRIWNHEPFCSWSIKMTLETQSHWNFGPVPDSLLLHFPLTYVCFFVQSLLFVCFQKHVLKEYKAELQGGFPLQDIWKYFQTVAYINLATCIRANKRSLSALQGLLKQYKSGIWHRWDGNLISLTLLSKFMLKTLPNS